MEYYVQGGLYWIPSQKKREFRLVTPLWPGGLPYITRVNPILNITWADVACRSFSHTYRIVSLDVQKAELLLIKSSPKASWVGKPQAVTLDGEELLKLRAAIQQDIARLYQEITGQT